MAVVLETICSRLMRAEIDKESTIRKSINSYSEQQQKGRAEQ